MTGDELFRQMGSRAPFNRLHPRMAEFFKDYLAHEKVVRFGDRYVVNTQFPPYPSRAFDHFAEGFTRLGDVAERRLYSVTLGVTNRCSFRCWHCYNAGRSQRDVPTAQMQDLIRQLQDRGAVLMTLTGGEPLLRDDLEALVACADDRSCVIVGTTGEGLTRERAERLRDGGVFGIGISLDSHIEREHDRLRGRKGAFEIAMNALQTAHEAGLYSYVVTVGTTEMMESDGLMPLIELAGRSGAYEVHLLEPCPIGRLQGRDDVRLREDHRAKIFEYQKIVSVREDLPILSSYAYLESGEAFGCGAGLTHLTIDGSGEVSPCQFVPLSFGNIQNESLDVILARMGKYFQRPRCECIGHVLGPRIRGESFPLSTEESIRICAEHLPREHDVPRFFRILETASDEVGRVELESAYDEVHEDYDQYWLSQAGQPVEELVRRIDWRGTERVFEAGCGTGFATVMLGRRARSVVAADVSEGMLSEARRRVEADHRANVEFLHGDALELLRSRGPFDVVFTSWVLGYIPLRPFFTVAAESLAAGGRVTLIVHRQHSPREPMEVFTELVSDDPTVLSKRVFFDFPVDADHLRREISEAGLVVRDLWEGEVVFPCDSARGVMDHLMKSGAGTAYYQAVDPQRRDELTEKFVRRLAERMGSPSDYRVRHEYFACIADKK